MAQCAVYRNGTLSLRLFDSLSHLTGYSLASHVLSERNAQLPSIKEVSISRLVAFYCGKREMKNEIVSEHVIV